MITIVLTAQLEEAGNEFMCALEEMLASRGMTVDFRKTDGGVTSVIAVKRATGMNVVDDSMMPTEVEQQYPQQPEEAPSSTVCACCGQENCSCEYNECECSCAMPPEQQSTPEPEPLYVRIPSISSLPEGIACNVDAAQDITCLYVRDLCVEPDHVTFNFNGLQIRYPKCRPSAALEACNSTAPLTSSTICCGVYLPSGEAVKMLVSVCEMPDHMQCEYLCLGQDCVALITRENSHVELS